MIQEQRITSPRISLGILAFLVGCLVNYVGDRILGIRIELFYGLETFNFVWFLQLFIWPVVVGVVVAAIFGRGGKWLAYFPPFFVRLIAYYETQYLIGVPENASLMPMGWWIFFVILAVECAAIGGIIGEILVKKSYGRSDHADAAQSVEEKAAPVSTAARDGD